MEAYNIYRSKYKDEFIFIIVEDKISKYYRLVNLTSKTILVEEFLEKNDALNFLENVNGWICTKISL